MGLYFNKSRHPTVFQSEERIPERNQFVYRVDFLEQLLTEQKGMNESINESIDTINEVVEQYGNTQSKQLENLNTVIVSVKNKQVEQASSDKHIKNTLDMLLNEHVQSHQAVITNLKNLLNNQNEKDEKIQQLLEKLESEQTYLRDTMQAYFTKIIDQQEITQKQLEEDDLTQEKIQTKLEDITNIGTVFKEQLQSIETTQQQLLELIESVKDNQETMTTKMDEHGDYQSGIIERLEMQEAYTDKIIRQLDHLRSIIFERAGVLVEKLEKGFKQTTSHITRFFNGTQRQSLQEFNQEVEEEKINMKK